MLLMATGVFGAGGDMGIGTDPNTNGSATYPYLIEDSADFDVFAGNSSYWATNVHMKLMSDLDFSGKTYTTAVIAPDTDNGTSGHQGTIYAGVFDGNDFTVSNLVINTVATNNDYLGLFGSVGTGGQVKKLNVQNAAIQGRYRIGALTGSNNGTISNCYSSGSVSGSSAGGLCGSNNSTITNCYSTATVTGSGNSYVGGLCAYNTGSITGSYASGTVTGSGYASAGGLCGGNYSGSIINCYSTGTVGGGAEIGGLCGYNFDDGSIANCYSTSPVAFSYTSVGGLCGINRGSIMNCYFYRFGGSADGWATALDDLELLDRASYVGFDFAFNSEDGTNDDWMIVQDHCPKLSWQADDGPTPPFALDAITTMLSGSGYSNDPFVISNYDDLIEFRTNAALRIGYYILTDDIDLAGQTYSSAFIPEHFNGNFDGDAHVIGNFNLVGIDYVAFFSSFSGDLVNLGLEAIDVSGEDFVGGIIGRNYHGDIRNCYCTDTAINGSAWVGGLCGGNGGSITNCYTTGTVSGSAVGGICGLNYGNIISCFSMSAVSGYSDAGGLCGYNSRANIINCYSTGTVSGTLKTGGFCGYNKDAYITGSYSTGFVSGENSVGGFCAHNQGGSITSSFWDKQTSGLATSSGGTGLQTAEMHLATTYESAGWNLYEMWGICDGYDYPHLRWEDVPHCILVSNKTIDFESALDDPQFDVQMFTITNGCPGTLNWSIDPPTDCNWLSVQPLTGHCTADSNDVTLTINPEGLDLGFYYCDFAINDDDISNCPVRISVSLHVRHPGERHVPMEYPTIRAAVDATVDDDHVVVHPGTYEGCTIRDKRITVRSVDPDDPASVQSTIIASRIYLAQSQANDPPLVKIEGLSFIRSYPFDQSSRGIDLWDSAAEIRNCIFKNWSGGGIVCGGQRSDILIENCIIVGNGTAGILIPPRSTVSMDINRCTIVGTNPDHGRVTGIRIDGYHGNQLHITNSILSNCKSPGDAEIYFTSVFLPTAMNYASISNSCIPAGPNSIDIPNPDLVDFTYGPGNIETDPLFVRNPDDGGDGWFETWDTPDIDENANNDYGDLHLKSQAGRFLWEGFAQADFNMDQHVDSIDFAQMANSWASSIAGVSPVYPWNDCDLDKDLSIGLGDLVLFAADYLQPRVFGAWIADELTSPCIDAGDPADTAWQNEPFPHGQRINMGAYGGTPQASMSPNPVGNAAE